MKNAHISAKKNKKVKKIYAHEMVSQEIQKKEYIAKLQWKHFFHIYNSRM